MSSFKYCPTFYFICILLIYIESPFPNRSATFPRLHFDSLGKVDLSQLYLKK